MGLFSLSKKPRKAHDSDIIYIAAPRDLRQPRPQQTPPPHSSRHADQHHHHNNKNNHHNHGQHGKNQRHPYPSRRSSASEPQLQLIPSPHHAAQQQQRQQPGGRGGGKLQPYLVEESGSYPRTNHPFASSMVNLAKEATSVPGNGDGLAAWCGYGSQLVGSTISALDEVSVRLNDLLTQIDDGSINGNENDLFMCRAPPQPATLPMPPHTYNNNNALVVAGGEQQLYKPPRRRGHSRERSREYSRERSRSRDRQRDSDREWLSDRGKTKCSSGVAASVVQGNYFSKVELYANSKLPTGLPPFAVYIPTWPLLCLAAQYSQAVYIRPEGHEREAHVSADWFSGTKAMVIKSVPMDHMRTIVFAVRGTASFMDWTVNLNNAPTPPTGFLDDPGNLCHAGFLSVARKMVKPVAARLRQLLHEDPSRSKYSLLITGHSAGGAVASLLYSHMQSSTKAAQSELSKLTGSFKRVHCVTFGTPPISILPLIKPNRTELKNSVFLSFVNEGDPVVRADKAYVKSLLELLASSPPSSPAASATSIVAETTHSTKTTRGRSPSTRKPKQNPSNSHAIKWPVPPCSLSNAGRLVVLRNGPANPRHQKHRDRMTVRQRLDEGVVANTCDEEQLRGMIWGDPVAHLMSLYAGRIEMLAINAVTAKNFH